MRSNKKTRSKPAFARAAIEQVNGYRLSDGRIVNDIVQAEAMQAKIDLAQVINHYIDFEDGNDTMVLDMMLEQRDYLIDLMTAAFMTPSEIDAKMDDIARDRVSPSKGKHGVGKPLPFGGFNPDQPFMRATPCNGVNMPLDHFAVSYQISDDLPADVIGECVTSAVHRAWRSGIDPALDPFCVIVTFGGRGPDTCWVPAKKAEPIAPDGDHLTDDDRLRTEQLSPEAQDEIGKKAFHLFGAWRSNHPSKTPSMIGEWEDQDHDTRQRFINEARRELMI